MLFPLLLKKDPRIIRTVFKKKLLLARSPMAREPLFGALFGFRKLVAGDRDWRIEWRVEEDASGVPILEILEVWSVGARSDGEVYDELILRVARMGDDPSIRPLRDAIIEMARLYESFAATAEPERKPALPEWMVTALQEQLGSSVSEILGLTEGQAQRKLMEHYWSRKSE
ncbi:hypothetical protein [Glutamicibacter sp. X7]